MSRQIERLSGEVALVGSPRPLCRRPHLEPPPSTRALVLCVAQRPGRLAVARSRRSKSPFVARERRSRARRLSEQPAHNWQARQFRQRPPQVERRPE